MNLQRRFLLWSFTGLLVLISGILVWNRALDLQTHFLAGTKPASAETAAPSPTLPTLRTTDPAKGAPIAGSLLMVEFGDFTCPSCRLAEPEIKQALAASPVPIHFIWRDLPVGDGHTEPIVAALAGRCAADQNKFWEMHDALFLQQTFDTKSLVALAQKLGMDTNKFRDCERNGQDLKAIADDMIEARQHNFSIAPTLFVGRKILTGSFTSQDILSAIRTVR